MRDIGSIRLILGLGLLLPLAGSVSAQNASDPTAAAPQTAPAPEAAPARTLVVNGKTAGATVRVIDGHSYVDIEAVAALVNGSVTIAPDRVLLTIPIQPPPAAANSTAAAAAPANTATLSKDFASAAISELAEMREWRGVISAMVTYGLAVSGTLAQDYHDRVEEGLRQTAVVASTDADKQALQLLTSDFDTLSGWANDILTARAALNGAKTVDPNALANDATLAKITNCSRFLNGMLVSGSFSDDGTCH